MSIPNIKEIISLYLYGQQTPPGLNNLADDRWIRSAAIPGIKATSTTPAITAATQGATIQIDSNEYMTIGGGRFATPEKFDLVQKFLNGRNNIPTGSHTISSLLNYGLSNTNLTVYQYVMGMFDADYADRAYVGGSTGFKITGGDFIVNPDGSREIKKTRDKASRR